MLLQMLDGSYYSQGLHNNLLGLVGNYFFT